jgi:adenylate cyclase
MSETRKLAAILVADVVGYSRLAGADEERTLARLRGLRSDLFDPTIAVHHGRIVKRTGDGSIIEFRSVVDAVRGAIEVQTGMAERNAGVPPERRIEFRIGIHLGDVVEESDGDLMGDGVNIAARLEGVAKPGAICLSEDAYRQVKGRLDRAVTDLGASSLRTSLSRCTSTRSKSTSRRRRNFRLQPWAPNGASHRAFPLLSCHSPTSAAILSKSISPMASPRV